MITELHMLQGIIERGCVFAMPVIGAFIASRVIAFDDLTLQGSFGLGGAVGTLLITMHMPWWVQIPAVIAAGACAGLCTGLLYSWLRINTLISGIVVMTGLFSVNLKLAGAHHVIPRDHTIFAAFGAGSGLHWIVLTIAVIGITYLIRWLLQTEYGLFLFAVGDNTQVVINNGRSPDIFRTTGLMLANAISAIGGYLLVSYVGYFSIWSSVGVLIISLAGLMLSEITGALHMGLGLTGGAIMYQALIALTYQFNIDQDWNKCITAALIVILLSMRKWNAR